MENCQRKNKLMNSSFAMLPVIWWFIELNTYEDFLKSDCEIIILITDSVFVDIYAKDEMVINKIKYNAEQCDFKDIAYITDENDYRTYLSAI